MSKILTYEQVLEILSEQARNGSVTAAAALERALRSAEKREGDVDDDIARILAK
jgi:hypothetical protein